MKLKDFVRAVLDKMEGLPHRSRAKLRRFEADSVREALKVHFEAPLGRYVS